MKICWKLRRKVLNLNGDNQNKALWKCGGVVLKGPTGIKEPQPFSQPLQEVGTLRAGAMQAQVLGP